MLESQGNRQPPPGWASLERAGPAEATLPQSPTSSFGSRLRHAAWLALSGPGMDAPRFAPSNAQTCSAHRLSDLPHCRVGMPLLQAPRWCARLLRSPRYPVLDLAHTDQDIASGRWPQGLSARRFFLIPAAILALALAGCGSSGPTPAQKEAQSIAHEIACGGVDKLGKERYCEHPALVQAEEQERKREEPAIVQAEEREEGG